MRMLCVIFFSLFLTSCITVGDNPNYINARNSCLPNAIGFREAYKVNHVMSQYAWSRILWYGKHAFCTYALEDKIWIYDILGGSRETDIPYNLRNEAKQYLPYTSNMNLEYTGIEWLTQNDK